MSQDNWSVSSVMYFLNMQVWCFEKKKDTFPITTFNNIYYWNKKERQLPFFSFFKVSNSNSLWIERIWNILWNDWNLVFWVIRQICELYHIPSLIFVIYNYTPIHLLIHIFCASKHILRNYFMSGWQWVLSNNASCGIFKIKWKNLTIESMLWNLVCWQDKQDMEADETPNKVR